MPSVPVVGVLALQGGVREHFDALGKSGAEPRSVKTLAQLGAVDALVIPGGESSAIEKLARKSEMLEPLRVASAGGMPIFGSCAGMILLADRVVGAIEGQESIGGLDITVERNAFGRQMQSFESGIAIAGIRDPKRDFDGVFIRAPWVLEAGNGCEVIARITSGPHKGRIVGVRNDTLLATSFHPELTADYRVHELFVDMVRKL
ncbi:MAG: pyridoxal 5'-phosphate synthase glutaminase subunit PdxT [Candidatus Nanopelagicales bacterium]|nr:pyridoxal 5'-phosphate synthase glutaminase subunit PdxT [Candidatus Nanopelagicales bacterium]